MKLFFAAVPVFLSLNAIASIQAKAKQICAGTLANDFAPRGLLLHVDMSSKTSGPDGTVLRSQGPIRAVSHTFLPKDVEYRGKKCQATKSKTAGQEWTYHYSYVEGGFTFMWDQQNNQWLKTAVSPEREDGKIWETFTYLENGTLAFTDDKNPTGVTKHAWKYLGRFTIPQTKEVFEGCYQETILRRDGLGYVEVVSAPGVGTVYTKGFATFQMTGLTPEFQTAQTESWVASIEAGPNE